MADPFDKWFNGAPVLPTGATGDFAAWSQGAPVLQLQLSATVEIVGSGGVEVGGAATIVIVVHGEAPASPGIGVRMPFVPRRRLRRRREQRAIVGSGGIELGAAADLAVAVSVVPTGGIACGGAAPQHISVLPHASGGVRVGGAADQQVAEPGAAWPDRLLREDEELLLLIGA